MSLKNVNTVLATGCALFALYLGLSPSSSSPRRPLRASACRAGPPVTAAASSS